MSQPADKNIKTRRNFHSMLHCHDTKRQKHMTLTIMTED